MKLMIEIKMSYYTNTKEVTKQNQFKKWRMQLTSKTTERNESWITITKYYMATGREVGIEVNGQIYINEI